jgi:type IV pilus assembly protein PilB
MALLMTDPLNVPSLLLGVDASGSILMSFWKPVLPLIVLGGWAWVVASVYDKHAARFFLAREKWNIFHLVMGTLALAAAFLMPVPGHAGIAAGLGAMIVILAIDLVAYAVAVSRDDRVPEQFKIRVDVLQKMAASRAEKRKTKSAGAAKLVVRFPDKSTMPVPEAESPEMAVRSAAEMVYLSALAQRASQIEIVPSGKDQTYAVRMLVDGVGIAGDTMPAQNAIRVMDWWKSTAKLDVADRRKKLQGLATIEHAGGKRTIRVTSIGVQGGMRVEILFDPDTAVRRPAKDLGLLDNQMEELKALIADEKRGVVVLAGPPDGGRTTAFYSIVGMHDAYTQSVGTHEMDQQLILEGVRHQQFDAQTDGPDFATSTRSLLRRDPDVLGVAEMPDANTAKEIAKADGERTRTYVGVRATSATEGIEKYVQAVGDNALAAKHFRGVVAGRLLRKLCINCRVAYPPSPDMLKKLGVNEPGKVPQLFKKGGQVLIKNKPEVCPVCGGSGYIGQEGIFEVFHFSDENRKSIAEGNLAALRAALKARGLPSIQQSAIRKALLGVTSVEEVQRVTAPPAAPAPAAAAPPKA